MSPFEEAYQSLNPAQREAVDTIEGPVMVIAGPGTGKTQILAIRIGKILLETDTRPENILCMTYTDSGALAMRKRLLKMIGTEAYKVNIHTYHSFCNQIIQDNLSFFEKNSLDPISELESIALMRELIDKFPQGHPLKRYRSDVYFETKNLRQLFSSMKREGWQTEEILNAVQTYLNDLPNREEFTYKRKYKQFNAGDLKIEKINEEKERMQKLEAAAKEFDHFQKIMHHHRRYDFDDMINWVIRAFQENKNLLAQYQEQFQYVLVDEYQDTSGTQNKLVEMLINYWEEPNVFVVGDDDQSIFRFQGANVENMLSFAKKYPSIKTILLQENYRSTQPILDTAKSLIDKNQERLVHHIEGLNKNLIAGNENLQSISLKPVVQVYKSPREEMISITNAIDTLIKHGTAPNRIAVIYRENIYGEELSAFLKNKSILYFSKRNINLLSLPLIKKIILLFEYLEAEMDMPFSGDERLFEMLHFDWFNIRPIEIAKLSLENTERAYKKEQTGFRNIIDQKTNAIAGSLFEKNISDELSNAGKIIEGLIASIHNITLQQLLEKIIHDTGLLGVIMSAPDNHWQLQILTSFFDFMKDETKKDPTMNLKKFVKVIQLMEKENIRLPIVQVGGSEKGVNLLTAHGSKGLEFEHVFLAGSNANYWEKKSVSNNGYKLPDTLFASNAVSNNEEELRRLFYVAITRAETNLTISYSTQNKDGKGIEASQFVEEIKESQQLDEIPIELEDATIHEFNLIRLANTSSPVIEQMDTDIIDKALDKFSMNVTALNNYLKCPLEFYYKNLIRIPSPKNETLEFGSAVHYALEAFFNKMKNHPTKEFPSRESLVEDFILYIYRHRESFTKEEFDRRLEYGKDVLIKYYDKKINSFNKVVSIERNIRNVTVDGVPLKGKIDKMEFDGHQVNVVDYKTGNPEKAKEKLKTPAEQEPFGGDYWRQAVFYKLLIDNYEQGKYQVVSTEFDFIEPNTKKEIKSIKVNITNEDTLALREQIIHVWERIQDRDFYKGCGKDDCHWCNFVKTNKLDKSEIEDSDL
ncbi:MAG: ATP-dependent helicase [Bacteroidota bacterium]|jgi:DNA helicase-2/ATP-dependent DNA helicase PcrA